MSRIDLFESVFKAATRDVFVHDPPSWSNVLVVTDLEAAPAAALTERARALLAPALASEAQLVVLDREQSRELGPLLDAVQARAPDLVVTCKNLHTSAWRWPHTLGDHLEVLTQQDAPVLVLPRPGDQGAVPTEAHTVVAVTDHLAGDHRLVNHAAALVPDGTLFLAHVEDDAVFARYIEAISRIPAVDTEVARDALRARLLQDPAHFIASCAEVLAKAAPGTRVQARVTMGHHLSTYLALVDEHAVDVVVMNTKDDDQHAMHGLAYPLAVQLHDVALLML